VGSIPARNPVDDVLRRVLPDRVAGPTIRWLHALLLQGFYQVSRRHPGLVKRLVRDRLRRELPPGYDIGTHFTPRYDPWDQRFCATPDGDLFAAIRQGGASVVTDRIERFTKSGLLLESGTELEADVVVTATGLELQFLGGAELSIAGEPLDLPSKLTYKGMMLEDVPNFAFAVGYTNASWTLKVDLTCDYVCRILDHMHRRALPKVVPVADGAPSTGEPLMGLNSGYIQRAAHLVPRQGTHFPWRVHQSFLRDYRAMKLSGVEGDGLVFSDPRSAVTIPGAPGAPVPDGRPTSALAAPAGSA
jgi:cation diffusion facilitator CzcD-associated flavoprotein CzcO